MGFNLSAVVVSKNYQHNWSAVKDDLGWNLKGGEPINFETASSNWKDEGICDVYFAEHGTVFFMEMDRCISPVSAAGLNILAFAISETSMAFCLNYCEGNVVKRELMEVNGERMTDEGDPLSTESESTGTDEIIWNQFNVVLGKNFSSVEMSEPAYRYRFV